MSDGRCVGVRAPLHGSELPIVQPYSLVENIDAAIQSLEAQGALPSMEIPDTGKIAIVIHGGNNHDLWQL